MRIFVIFALAIFLSYLSSRKVQSPSETGASQQDTEKKPQNVTPAVLIKKVAPEYPKKVRKQHIEGTVRFHAIIAQDGTIKNLEVLSGDALLVDAALKAVRQWRYQPTQINGKPVEIDTTIDVVFALNKTS